VAGLHALHERFGRLPWKDLFQSAIFNAEDGYPVPEIIASDWNDSVEWISQDPEDRRVYLHGGKPPALGYVFQNHDLDKTLQLVAPNGAAAFYKDEIARAIIRVRFSENSEAGTRNLESEHQNMEAADRLVRRKKVLFAFCHARSWLSQPIVGQPVGMFARRQSAKVCMPATSCLGSPNATPNMAAN
jgi:hypothetical protein